MSCSSSLPPDQVTVGSCTAEQAAAYVALEVPCKLLVIAASALPGSRLVGIYALHQREQLALVSADMLRSVHNQLLSVMINREQVCMTTTAQGRRQQLVRFDCHQRSHWLSRRLLCYAAGLTRVFCVAAAAAGCLPALSSHSVSVSPGTSDSSRPLPDPSLVRAVLPVPRNSSWLPARSQLTQCCCYLQAHAAAG